MFADLRTLADPIELEDVRAMFPIVVFVPAPKTEDDDQCSGCPESSVFKPPSVDAILVYRWWGHWVRQPVGSCCLDQELRDLTESDAVTELRVEVLVEPTDTPYRRPSVLVVREIKEK